MNEIWKSVVGYENLYEVSSFGRVRSVDRTTIGKTAFSDDSLYHFKGKILKQGNKKTSGMPYKQVVLYKNKKHKKYIKPSEVNEGQAVGHIPPEIGFSLTKTGFKVSQKQYEKFMDLLKVGENNEI